MSLDKTNIKLIIDCDNIDNNNENNNSLIDMNNPNDTDNLLDNDNLTDNDLTDFGSLASDQNLDLSDYNVDNYTSTSSTGIAVDGVIMYPSLNNVLVYATFAAEITSTGIHVGRGMGFHYHADGHAFNQNGINLYNIGYEIL